MSDVLITRATTTSATSTDLYVSGIASTTQLRANSAYFGNVGIGTTTPQWKAQISGTGASQLTLSDSGLATSNHFSFRNSNGIFYIATSSATSFATSSIATLTIDGTTGNIGIGTTTPRMALNIVTNQTTPLVVQTTGSTGVSIASSWPTLGLNMYHNGEQWVALGDGYTGMWQQNPTTGVMSLGISRTSRTTLEPLSSTPTVDMLSFSPTGATGIGTTTSRGYQLQIATTSVPQLTLSDSGLATSNHFSFRNSNGILYVATSSATSFATSTTAALTIDGTTGYVGVGTTTPQWKAQISGTNAPQLTLSDSGLATSNHWTFRNSNGQLYLDTAGATTYATSTTAKLTIDGTSGNVGIGTSTPTVPLTIGGSGSDGGSDAGINVLQNFNGSGVTMLRLRNSGTVGAGTFFQMGANATANILGFEVYGSDHSTQANYAIIQQNTSAPLILQADGNLNQLVLRNTGNVGIGTTTPQWKLQVSATAVPQLTLSDSGLATSNHWSFRNSNGILYFATSSATSFATTSTAILTIDGTTGKIGISSTSPMALLTVAGSNTNALRVDNGSGANILTVDSTLSSTDSGIDITAGGAQAGNLLNIFSSGGSLLTYITAAGGFQQNISSSTAVRIQNGSASDVFVINSTTGLIGIGTTTPIAILDVFKADGDATAAFTASTTAGVHMAWTIGTDLSDSGKFKIASSTLLGLNDRLVIDAEGNTGISTSTPQWKLQISDTAAPQLVLSDSGSITSRHFSFRNSNGIFYLATSSPTSFATSTTPQLTVDGNTGNVGVGTSTPRSRFQIAETGLPQLTLSDSGSITSRHFSFRNSNGIFYLATSSPTSFATSTTPQLTVDGNTGNVGVGTSTPQFKLQVSSTGLPQLTLSDSGLATANHFSFRNSNGILYIATSSPTSFATSSTPALTIDGTEGSITFNSGLGLGTGGNYLCIDTTTYEVLRGNGAACTASSLKFKENIEDLKYGLGDVLKLRPVSYNYKQGTNMGEGIKLGFIAEEVQELLPEVVTLDNEGNVFGLDYPILTSVLTKAIQEIAYISGSFK
ncbi:MAG: tail fiber domain-containing protein, partial [Patescibacteria group bacterium]